MSVCSKKPCKDCPFLKGKSYLSTERAEEIAQSVIDGYQFPCHKTLGQDEEGETVVTSKSKFCAGSLIFAEKANGVEHGGAGMYANQLIRIHSRMSGFSEANLDMSAEVYESLDEMIEGHSA